MRKRIIKALLSLALSIALLFCLTFALNTPIGNNIYLILGAYSSSLIGQLAIFFLVVLFCVLFFINVYQLMGNRIPRLLIRIDAIAYLLGLFAIVMLKSRWMQGVNLDILDLYAQLYWEPLQVVFNILFFIPLGALIFRYIKSPLKAFPLALGIIVLIEILQFVFHSGFTDIVDVVMNMLGFAIGYMTFDILRDKGFHIVALDKKHVRIAFPQKSHRKNEALQDDKEQPGSPKKRFKEIASANTKLIAVISTALVLTVLFFVGAAFFNLEDYLPKDPQPIESPNPILSSLPKSSLTVEETREIIEGIGLFRVNGIESSNSWIEVDESGALHSAGDIQGWDTWLRTDGNKYHCLWFCVYETLGGVTVTHVIPLIVTPQTEISWDKEKYEGDLAENFPQNFLSFDNLAVYTLQDGWFQAESLFLSLNDDKVARNDASFNFISLSEDTQRYAGFEGGYWFEAQEGKRSTLQSILERTSLLRVRENYIAMRIPDRVGSALICHILIVQFEDGLSLPYSGPEPGRQLYVTLKNGKLILVE
ncbi:MAG: VanZ family protein [Coriobacteriia bacterium]|nr:VanZ family protein [Coriobacteriia bacterium]